MTQLELQEKIGPRNTTTPTKGPAHHQLRAFVGHWKVHGFNESDGAGTAERAVIGDEIYEWLEGEYFLLNRFDRQQGIERFTGLGWIGFDAASDGYLSYSIANTGHLRVYEVEVSPRRLRLFGEHERATIALNVAGNTMSVLWERSPDGKNWSKLCELHGHRLN